MFTFLAGSAVTKVYDSWKRIRFVTSDWKLWYVSRDSEGGMVYKETPPGFSISYHFTIRFFNEKPSPIGLHRFAVLFTKGVLHNRQILVRDEEVKHGERQIRAGQMYREPLGEMLLPRMSGQSKISPGTSAMSLQAKKRIQFGSSPTRPTEKNANGMLVICIQSNRLLDTLELGGVARHQLQAVLQGDGGDHRVGQADDLPGAVEVGVPMLLTGWMLDFPHRDDHNL